MTCNLKHLSGTIPLLSRIFLKPGLVALFVSSLVFQRHGVLTSDWDADKGLGSTWPVLVLSPFPLENSGEGLFDLRSQQKSQGENPKTLPPQHKLGWWVENMIYIYIIFIYIYNDRYMIA